MGLRVMTLVTGTRVTGPKYRKHGGEVIGHGKKDEGIVAGPEVGLGLDGEVVYG